MLLFWRVTVRVTVRVCCLCVSLYGLLYGYVIYACVQVQVCTPRALYICDGTQSEADEVIHKLMERGTLHKLTHSSYKDW